MDIKQHTPGWADYDPTQAKTTENFNSAELAKVDFVEQWTKFKDFHQLSVSEIKTNPTNGKSYRHLMAEFDKGYSWWVIGYVYDTQEVLEAMDFPIWEAKYRPKEESASTESEVEPAIVPLDDLLNSGVVKVHQDGMTRVPRG